MFTKCDMCQNQVLIRNFTEHLFYECIAANQVKKCPRCKMPIKRFYKEHVKAKKCQPAGDPGLVQRCPLCLEDIPKGGIGWKDHLIHQGCRRNIKK